MKFSPESLSGSSIKRKESESNLVPEENIIDIEPEKETTATPIVVVQGWGKNGQNFKKNSLDILAGQGRRVVSFESPRAIKIEAEDSSGETLPTAEIQKAEAIIDTLNQKGIDRADAIGWSEGGINLAIAAFLHPERFKNLVFVDPAGMIGNDSLFGLVYRFGIKEAAQSKMPAEVNKKDVAIATVKYLLENPSLCLQEIKSISQADIYEFLKSLKAKGIGISFVFGTEDKVFPMERVQQTYHDKKETGEVKDFRDILDGFYSVKGTHGEFLGHGESDEPYEFPKAVGHILEALDKKTEEKEKEVAAKEVNQNLDSV